MTGLERRQCEDMARRLLLASPEEFSAEPNCAGTPISDFLPPELGEHTCTIRGILWQPEWLRRVAMFISQMGTLRPREVTRFSQTHRL